MSRSRAHAAFDAAEGRTALLVIDMQNAFFEDKMLASAQEELVSECNTLIRTARDNDVPVLVITTEHVPDHSTWTVSMLDDDQGFIFSGTGQADIVRGLEVEGAQRVLKRRDSAFFGTDLAERLRDLGVDRILLAGVSTHNCVAHTGADAFASDFRAGYARDAIGSTNMKYAEAMLEILSAEYRQPILDRAEAEAALNGPVDAQD